ncbi:MAG TPA: oxidoreductase [Bacteroidales bacterium]|nr:oxidoreductase [Bacteroidales bacterium]
MEEEKFKAFVIDEQEEKYIRSIKTRLVKDLPEGDLLIKVHYSSLNYKDALSSTGNKGVTKRYPHTPGIDAVGTIVESNSTRFSMNEEVIVTSYNLGMDTSGGFGQYIRVPASWAVKLPKGLSMKESMILGTAGLTATLLVLRLSERVSPDQGNIVVSGATGGVGSLSVAILTKLGYHVVAITGKEQEKDFLFSLGTKEIILRKDFEEENPRPMLSAKFAGGIDTVGGTILENIIKSTQNMGVVACCGNAASPKINLTVFPFILRGVSLIGIGTQDHPMPERKVAWNLLATDWKPDKLMDMYTEVSLDGLSDKIDLILQGKIRGRVLVNLDS